jgi:hypothetical protein
MHDDDKRWLRDPILPRPGAVPALTPELRALIGFEPGAFENDAPSRALADADAADHIDTELHELAASSGVHVRAPVVRTGT